MAEKCLQTVKKLLLTQYSFLAATKNKMFTKCSLVNLVPFPLFFFFSSRLLEQPQPELPPPSFL